MHLMGRKYWDKMRWDAPFNEPEPFQLKCSWDLPDMLLWCSWDVKEMATVLKWDTLRKPSREKSGNSFFF